MVTADVKSSAVGDGARIVFRAVVILWVDLGPRIAIRLDGNQSKAAVEIGDPAASWWATRAMDETLR